MSIRPIKSIIQSQPTIEGAGVKLRRAFGFGDTGEFDPFLLLDDFRNEHPEDYLAGFPWHPHRGIETITYVLSGTVQHGDSLGNRGALGAGDVQWMTAGSGILHQEMPRGDERGRMHGFQLWANLPAALKMTAPRYQDIPPEKIPEVELAPGVRARVIAGEAAGVRGPVEGIVTQPLYLDVRMEPRSRATLLLTPGHAACAYVYEGQVALGADTKAQEIAAGRLAVLGDGDRLTAVTGGAAGRFLLLAARPLREPIARYGPFVMNTREEIVQAVEDYRSGALASGV